MVKKKPPWKIFVFFERMEDMEETIYYFVYASRKFSKIKSTGRALPGFFTSTALNKRLQAIHEEKNLDEGNKLGCMIITEHQDKLYQLSSIRPFGLSKVFQKQLTGFGISTFVQIQLVKDLIEQNKQNPNARIKIGKPLKWKARYHLWKRGISARKEYFLKKYLKKLEKRLEHYKKSVHERRFSR